MEELFCLGAALVLIFICFVYAMMKYLKFLFDYYNSILSLPGNFSNDL